MGKFFVRKINDIESDSDGNVNLSNVFVLKSLLGANNGVATLDSTGKLNTVQIPFGTTANTIAEGDKVIFKNTTDGASFPAIYRTTTQSPLGIKVRLPFNTNSGKMLIFTLRIYGSYQSFDIQISGYLYSTNNQWLSPKAIGIGLSTNINVKFGRDTDGRAYVWIPGKDYVSIAVQNVVSAYQDSDWNTGWNIIRTDDTPNIVLDQNIYPDLTLAGGTLVGNLTGTTFIGALTGNATSATKLAASKNFTIGNTAKAFDGSINVAWTLAEIGAATATHTHTQYLDKSYLTGKPLSNANTITEGTQTNYLQGSNQPAGSQDGSLLSLSHSSIWSTQLYGDWRTNEWFVRTQNNGSWAGGWKKLWHDGNLNINDYLNKNTGGTIVGNVTFDQTSTVKFNGQETTNVTVFTQSNGVDTIVSGLVNKFYTTEWKVGNKRGGGANSLGYSFDFSSNSGTLYTQLAIIGTDGVITANGFVKKNGTGTNALLDNGSVTSINDWNAAYSWGNHKSVDNNEYLGTTYISGGLEKPNVFGSAKIKGQMLTGSNIGSGVLWNDVLYVSTYSGTDVKASNALVFGKSSEKIGFVRQDYDSTAWGPFREIYHSGNINPSTFYLKTGGPISGLVDITSGGQPLKLRSTTQGANYTTIAKWDTGVAIGYFGADGGAVSGGGNGSKFLVRGVNGLDLISDTGTVTANGSDILTIGNFGANSSWVSGKGFLNRLTVGELAWRNYSNGHTISDMSNSLSPSGTAVNNINPLTPWGPTYPVLMGWNGAGTYGVRVDSSRVADTTKTDWIHSTRDFPAGTLIYTNITYDAADGEPFFLEIKGNTYSTSDIPVNVTLQGYVYGGTIYNHKGSSNMYELSRITIMSIANKLCFWFPTLGYWSGFSVRCYVANPGIRDNQVTSIVNSGEPGGTRKVTTVLTQYITSRGGYITDLYVGRLGTFSGQDYGIYDENDGAIAVYNPTNGLFIYGNGAITYGGAQGLNVNNSLSATSIKKTGGTSTQLLMADGSTKEVSTITGTTQTLSISGQTEAGQVIYLTGGGNVTVSNYYVGSPDGTRNPTDIKPNALPRRVRFDFASAGTITGATGNYGGVMTYSPWDGLSTSTGDSSYQLAFHNETGVNGSGLPGLSLRKGIDTTWGSWYKFWHAGNFNPAAYLPLTGGTMTGNINAWNLGCTQTDGTGRGVSLYGGSHAGGLPGYGFSFATTVNYGTHGSVIGDWATYLTMDGAANRGWIFRRVGTNANVASISAIGEATFSKVTSSGGFFESSLRELKENIEPLKKSGLELINKLDIVSYDRIDGAKNKIGIIANDSPNEFLSEAKEEVDLYKTIFIQTKAIQELSDKNDKLTEELNNLRELVIAITQKITI